MSNEIHSGCPTRTALLDLLEGRVGSDSQAIEAHVQKCRLCQDALAAMTDDDRSRTWRRLLKDSDLSPAIGGGGDQNGSAPPNSAIHFSGVPTERGPIGRLGRYHIVRELGEGATGHVFLAYDEVLRRQV